MFIAPTGRRFGTNRRPAQWAISINHVGLDRETFLCVDLARAQRGLFRRFSHRCVFFGDSSIFVTNITLFDSRGITRIVAVLALPDGENGN